MKKKQKTKQQQRYKSIYNKQNHKNIYTSAIKIHSTISKLKKVRLKIALKSMQVWNIAKLMR